MYWRIIFLRNRVPDFLFFIQIYEILNAMQPKNSFSVYLDNEAFHITAIAIPK